MKEKEKTYFPISVLYIGDTKETLVKRPEDIISGKSFIVTGTNVEPFAINNGN